MAATVLRAATARACASALLAMLAAAAAAAEYVRVPAGALASVIASDPGSGPAPVPAFSMRATPVTKGEFRRFVEASPEWQRDHVPATFADAGYLHDWRGALVVGDPTADAQPVVNVSWFAAEAYCEGEGARLPTWLEWEYVAASDATRRDARGDPAWRARILGWYSTSARGSVATSIR